MYDYQKDRQEHTGWKKAGHVWDDEEISLTGIQGRA